MLSSNVGEVAISVLATAGLIVTFVLTGISKTTRTKNTRDDGDSNDHVSAGGK